MCTDKDISDRFFVHVTPNNVADIPKLRQKYKFDNLDFNAPRTSLINGSCYIKVELPKYKYKSITIGQYNKGIIWSQVINGK